jgi:hypothetical protein
MQKGAELTFAPGHLNATLATTVAGASEHDASTIDTMAVIGEVGPNPGSTIRPWTRRIASCFSIVKLYRFQACRPAVQSRRADALGRSTLPSPRKVHTSKLTHLLVGHLKGNRPLLNVNTGTAIPAILAL